MPFTPPGTITTGQVLTSALWNANVRDNSAYLKSVLDGTGTDRIPSRALGLVSARKTQSQVVSIPNNTYTPLYWDTTEYDDGGFTSAFTDRITIPQTGYYHYGAAILWFINAVGQRHLEITINGGSSFQWAQDRRLAVGDNARTPNRMVEYRKHFAGDILRVFCSQTSGGSLSLDVGSSAVAFWIALAKDMS